MSDDPIGARVVVLRLRVAPAGRGTQIQRLRLLLKALLRSYQMQCLGAQVEDADPPAESKET